MRYGGCWFLYRLSARLHAGVLIDEDANATVGGLSFFFTRQQERQRGVIGFVSPHTLRKMLRIKPRGRERNER